MPKQPPSEMSGIKYPQRIFESLNIVPGNFLSMEFHKLLTNEDYFPHDKVHKPFNPSMCGLEAPVNGASLLFQYFQGMNCDATLSSICPP